MRDHLTPLQRYQRDIDSGALLPDPAQAALVVELDGLSHRLVARAEANENCGHGLKSGWAVFRRPSEASTYGVALAGEKPTL